MTRPDVRTMDRPVDGVLMSIDSRVRVGVVALLVDDDDVDGLRLLDHLIVSYMHLLTRKVILVLFDGPGILFSRLTHIFWSCV